MRLNKILSVIPIATFMVVAALPAQAQGGFGIGFTKFGKKSAVSLGFHTGPIHHHRHGVVVVEPARRWVPGHYETRCYEVWVPGCTKTIYVEAVYRTVIDPHGHVTRILVRDGYYKTIQEPGRYETRCEQVWVAGYWV